MYYILFKIYCVVFLKFKFLVIVIFLGFEGGRENGDVLFVLINLIVCLFLL